MRLLGKGFVAIHSTADFSCSSIGTEKIFGFMYKQTSSNVSTLFQCKVHSFYKIDWQVVSLSPTDTITNFASPFTAFGKTQHFYKLTIF